MRTPAQSSRRQGAADKYTPDAADRLLDLIRRQELFEQGVRTPTALDRWRAQVASATATWFGVGVSGQDASRGLPVDVLAMVFAQEMVRRELGHPRGYVLVADSNALRSGVPSLEVRRAATLAQRSLQAVVDHFDFPVEVLRASELATPGELDAIVAGIETPNGYVAEQLAQMELMRQKGAGVKLGWTLSSSQFDEMYFDTLFFARFGYAPGCTYTIGGRTLDPRRPRACPYLCDDPERRLLLHAGEDVATKLESAPAESKNAVRGYRKLLGKLARAQHRLLGDRTSDRPEEVLQNLIDHLPE